MNDAVSPIPLTAMKGLLIEGDLYVLETDCRMVVNEAMKRARLAASARDNAALDMIKALKLCADRLESARKELIILNQELDRQGDPQNESADDADSEAVAAARAAIAKAEQRT